MSTVAPLLFLMMWSSGAIFVKLGLTTASVWTFLVVRAVGALATLLIVMRLWRPDLLRASFALDRRRIGWSLGLGLLLQGVYQACYFLAIDFDLSPGLLAIILGGQPLLMPWLAGERTTPWEKLLLLIGFGCLVFAMSGTAQLTARSGAGVAFGFAALLAISVGTAFQKRLDIDVARSLPWQYAGSVVLFAVVPAFAGWRADPTAVFLVSALWMILVVSVGANVLLLVMLSKHQASRIGNLFNFVPVVTVIADHLVFDAPVGIETVAGFVLVLGAGGAFTLLGRSDGARTRRG